MEIYNLMNLNTFAFNPLNIQILIINNVITFKRTTMKQLNVKINESLINIINILYLKANTLLFVFRTKLPLCLDNKGLFGHCKNTE